MMELGFCEYNLITICNEYCEFICSALTPTTIALFTALAGKLKTAFPTSAAIRD